MANSTTHHEQLFPQVSDFCHGDVMTLSNRSLKVLILFLLLAVAPLPRAQAQTQQPGSAPQAEARDAAEQLAAQLEPFVAENAKPSSIPQVFTGVTQDGKQLTLLVNGLPFEGKKRREFFLWLCQQYGVTAYAYATGVSKTGTHKKNSSSASFDDMEIAASSKAKDVFISMSWGPGADGALAYSRTSYRAEPAKERKDRLFSGILRSPRSGQPINSAEFAKVWESWKDNVVWRESQENVPQATPEELLSAAIKLYSSGNCRDALPLGMQAATLFKAKGGTQTADYAWALVAQALCQNQLGHATEAEQLYRQAIEIFEKVRGAKRARSCDGAR